MFQVTETKKLTRQPNLPARRLDARTRIHVFQHGESVLESLALRNNRPSKLYREVVAAQLPELADRIKWSRTAGCACGCSPGFIVDTVMRDEKHRPLDIFITAKFS